MSNHEQVTTEHVTKGLVWVHRLRGHEVIDAWSDIEPDRRFLFCTTCKMAWRRFLP